MARVYPNGAVAHGSLEGFGGSPLSISELQFPPNDRISDIRVRLLAALYNFFFTTSMFRCVLVT